MKTIEELRQAIQDAGLEECIIFENPSYASAAIGYTEDGRIAYDYDLQVARMKHKEATKTKACCNCIHCIRTEKNQHIECHCDVDGHYQGYLEVMGLRCELWEKEVKE